MPPYLSPDLSSIPTAGLSDNGITSHLASRFHQDSPFVTISSGTLIALNTFDPNVSDSNDHQYTANEPPSGGLNLAFRDLAARVCNRLAKSGENQSVLLLGESGSGKSEFRKSIVQHFMALSNNPLSSKIKHASRIFDAFTTTKTLNSLHASKAGNLLELQYNPESILIGASFLDYRLERSRVTKVPTSERNYHIFYYLLSGITQSERDFLQLDFPSRHSNSTYKYLGHSSQLNIGTDDTKQFQDLKSSFKSLGFSRTDIANICQVLAAVIHIGQLQFKDTLSSAETTNGGSSVQVENRDTLEMIASFLGVQSHVLETSLSYRSVYIKKDRVTLVLDKNGARENADELARCIYTLLFSWVISQINNKLSYDKRFINSGSYYNAIQEEEDELEAEMENSGSENQIENTISIVDFPGFNVFSSAPTLDKLLHNSANERFYNFFLSSYFDRLNERLESEEIETPSAEYFDNSETVRTLFRTNLGVLSIIDDYSKRNKSDTALMETFKRRFDKNPVIDCTSSRGSFTINHFAGEVEYDKDHLLAQNTESISGDIISIFTASSSSSFIKTIFKSSALIETSRGASLQNPVVQAQLSSMPLRNPSISRKSTRRKNSTISNKNNRIGNRKLTKQNQQSNAKQHFQQVKYHASGQFMMAIDNLMDLLEDTHPYFVLCLKINDRKSFGNFDPRCIRQQVRAFGISEIALRSKSMDVDIFLPHNRFIKLAAVDDKDVEGGDLLNNQEHEMEMNISQKIVSKRGITERDAKVGISGVFLSETLWLKLLDPDTSFTENANDLYNKVAVPSGESERQYADNDAFYYDPTNKTTSLKSGVAGDMFKFTDTNSVYTTKGAPSIIHAKEFGDGDDDDIDEIPLTGMRKAWLRITYFLTWWIPDFFIKVFGRMKRMDIRVAWREKLALNLLIWLFCLLVVFFLMGFPILVCPTQDVLSSQELSQYSNNLNPNKVYGSVRGVIFDLSKFAPGHYPSIIPTDDILDYGGKDMTDLFPIQISALCKGMNGNIDPSVIMGTATNYTDNNAKYHDFRYFTNDYRPLWYSQRMRFLKSNYKKGYIGITPKDMKKMVAKKQLTMASINGKVYDLSTYVSGYLSTRGTNGETVTGVETQFLSNDLVGLFQSYTGQDITSAFMKLDMDLNARADIVECLDNVFLVGKVDTRDSVRCVFARYFLLAIALFLVIIILFKFLAALQFSKSNRPEEIDRFIICQVPAYTEDEESLRRAIDSLARTKYDDKRKLLFIICDGMIVGAGNDRPTPRIVLDILGVPPEVEVEAFSFESLGDGSQQHNLGKVYSGIYEVQGHIVPFVVIVKIGKPTEINRPGNRGKRDSQMILMRFLNRVHYNLPMSPMELELYHQIQNVIGVNPAYYEYLLQVDADTVVAKDSISRMLSAMIHDTKIIALCGETAISNAKSSIVTMMQVYEYYISHNLAKAFESLFGSVTCLPGCFSVYRIFTEDSGKPLFVSQAIIQGYQENKVDTLHMKNLLHLGEDRYLTTLLLKHHPKSKTKFIRDAKAYTVAPDNWKVFLSQRRRWINSTVHNLMELVPLGQLCGFCCFGMRFIVIMDLVSTVIQPVTVFYLGYLFYLIAKDSNNVPLTSIIMLAAVYGLQALVFLLRRRWEMIGWMIIYILCIPIFSFALPLYSFWNMDDFSWGNTRVVLGEKGKKIVVSSEGKFDPKEIPLQTWHDYQTETWESQQTYDNSGDYGLEADEYYEHETMMESVKNDSYPKSNNTLSIVDPFQEVTSNFGEAYSQYEANSVDTTNRRLSSSSLLGSELREVDNGIEMAHLNRIPPTDEEITEAIKQILSTADLMLVTKKSIRAELTQFFGVNMDSRKAYINYVTEAVLIGDL
ncbi:hypothetical protein NADFUDRAFT_81629 [Nadsonia fulvescens var. elongata DSM 6958]|uniref:chitin synthase n=1 Tax=Nadsonia fulvescens var. elongata DSM 6958 TaxID=857566 RepID=A0A1E3PNJ0_9ASCO|nr:hypothetical protein NADFUDRAFT_81629 [Nadsonia fulvescens var. elongata DSM 6958]